MENVANFVQYRYPSNLMSTATERVARPCCRACLNSLWCCYRAHLLYSFCRTVRFPPATLPLAGTVLTVLPCSRAEATLVGTNKISCMRHGELLVMAKNTHCPQVLRARHLLTSVLLAMAPKVWMHKPDIPGLLVVRIVEKHSLSTGQIGPRQKKIPVKHSTNFVQNPGPSKAVPFQLRLTSPSHFPPSPSALLSFPKQELLCMICACKLFWLIPRVDACFATK